MSNSNSQETQEQVENQKPTESVQSTHVVQSEARAGMDDHVQSLKQVLAARADVEHRPVDNRVTGALGGRVELFDGDDVVVKGVDKAQLTAMDAASSFKDTASLLDTTAGENWEQEKRTASAIEKFVKENIKEMDGNGDGHISREEMEAYA